MGYVFNPFTGNFDYFRPATGAVTNNTNNYSSLLAPQLFNPDATAVTNDTDDYTLSSSNAVAFVTINGQTLDDSEYSLAGTTLTVTPDNGFNSTSDEVLVFQHVFDTSADGFIANITTKTANYTVLSSDHTILVDASSNDITLTLPAAADNSGRVFYIKRVDSSSNIVTIDGNASETIDGEASITLTIQYEAVTIQSDNSNWYII